MKSFKFFAVALALVGFAMGCGSDPESAPEEVVIASRYVYITNSGDNNVSQYTIGANGALVPMTPATVAAGNGPNGIAITPSHKYVYVSNADGATISQYAVGVNGALTAIAAPVATGTTSYFLSVTPDERFLFSPNYADNTIKRFNIGVNGALTLAATMANPGAPASISFSPSGAFAYVVNDTANTLSQYSVAADGTLNALSPATVPSTGCSASQPLMMKATGGGTFLYVLSCPSQNVESYAMASNGQMTSVGTVATGMGANGLAVTKKFVYATDQVASEVDMFSIQGNGTLAPLATPTVVVGSMIETLAINANQTFAYVIDSGANEVSHHSVSSSGQLTPVAGVPNVATGQGSRQILIW